MASFEDLQPYVGMPVRIRGKFDRSRHLMPALLISLDAKRAVVKPFGKHGREEVVPLSEVQVWVSGVARWREQHGG